MVVPSRVDMARNCLRINHEGDSIQLSWQRGQSMPRSAPSVAFSHPFDEETLAELRWYLEEYLRFPYGIFPENAAKIEQRFQDWGEELFELVFRSSEKAREFFQAATYDGLHQCELVIISDSPEVLNLPWELLYSPSDRQFLAPSLAGMSRSLSDYAVRAEMGRLPQDKLNILLVIARPYGEQDIGLRTIARPLLQSLANIRQKVKLKVLRPPSFEQFERELNGNKGFYHIVHFDGHGDFDPNSIGFQHTLGTAGQGLLVFEKNDGSPDIVTAAQIAQNLADCRVPIFVLNACKSAQEGEEKFSSVASRLVSLGAKGVVAMAYSVYAEAAKHFMGRLYGELAAGATLDSAVAAGRRDVLNKPLRPSPKGDKPLQDWLVPVLYQQEAYTPFIPTNTDTDVLDLEAFLEPTVSNLVGFPKEGAYGFVGRDYDILRLERGFRQNNIVLLQGMAGVGKTELACGFARWLEETEGRTGKMYFTSFEQGATLSNVVNQVGREVWGDKFAQYSAEQQEQAVLNDFHRVAVLYNKIGKVTQQLQDYQRAIDYYRKAIKFFEDTNNEIRAAFVYHNLGAIFWMQQKPDFDAAINYYNKALSIFEKFQYWREASLTLGNWGRALEVQQKWNEALKIYIQFWTMNFEHHLEWINGSRKCMGRMFKALGASKFDEIWQEVTGEECPEEVRKAIENAE